MCDLVPAERLILGASILAIFSQKVNAGGFDTLTLSDNCTYVSAREKKEEIKWKHIIEM